MTFQLTEKRRTRLNTTFHITDSAGDICGSVNVPNEAASDLLKHWRGHNRPARPPAPPRPRGPALNLNACPP